MPTNKTKATTAPAGQTTAGIATKMYKTEKTDKGLKISGPRGVGVRLSSELLADLKAVAGVPELDNHPRGILFRWAAEHAPTEALQDIANAVTKLTDEQSAVLYDLTLAAGNGGEEDWKIGWRNGLYYGLSQSPQ